MFDLVYANRMESLLEALAERLSARRTEGTSVLEPVNIVVANRNMERYVELGLAQALGVSANLRFHRLEHVVRDFLEELLPGTHVADRTTFEGGTLRALLDEELLAAPEMTPVQSYLRGGGDSRDAVDLRRVQLALKVGRLLDEYAFSRLEMVRAWSEGRAALAGAPLAGTEAWQRTLFAHAIEGHEPLHAALERAQRLAKNDAKKAPLHVFGLSYVAPAFHWAFRVLSDHRALHLYTHNPCREYWEDVPSKAHAFTAPDAAALSLWGRPTREHVRVLSDLTDGNFEERFEEPGRSTLLARVQTDILRRDPAREAQAPAARADGSLEVLACPGIRREVEAIADRIWALLEESGDGPERLRWNDIAVLLAGKDRHLYLPHIESVFAEAGDIPSSVVDIPLSAGSPVAEAALRLLGLPFTRCTRADVLTVLTHESVAGHAPDGDSSDWVALADRLGIYHGLDHKDHAGTYIEDDVINWDQGVRRLVLGAFMTGAGSGDDRTVEMDEARYLPEESESRDQAATFALLVRSLTKDVRFARNATLPLREWGRFLAALFAGYLVPTTDSEERALRRAVAAAEELATLPLGDAPVGYRVAAELARTALTGTTTGRGEYLADGVVVSTLVPMRAIPFRVVFVVGLGEAQFPTTERREAMDLRTHERMRSDVSPRERDEYTFLEALLSARSRLILSYVARDELTGDPIAPSSVVRQLLRIIARDHLPDAEGMLVHHVPLRRHTDTTRTVFAEAREEARAAALGKSLRDALGPGTLDADMLELAPALASALGDDWPRLRDILRLPPRPTPRVHVDVPAVSGPKDEMRGERLRLSLAALRRFLESPMQGWARTVLGVEEDDDHAVDAQEDEPLRTDNLLHTLVLRDAFLDALRRGLPLEASYRQKVRRQMDHGQWPVCALARVAEARDLAALAAWKRQLGAVGARMTRIRLGPGVEHEDADRIVPPLTLDMTDPRPGHSDGRLLLEITGLSGPMLESPSGTATLVARPYEGKARDERHLKYALRSFLDRAALLAAGAIPPEADLEVVLYADGESAPPAPRRRAAMSPEDARAFLETLARDLLEGHHAYRLPAEAVLACRHDWANLSRKALLEQVASLAHQVTADSYGPVPDPARFPPPPPDAIVDMARRRFGPFLESFAGKPWP